MHSGFHADLIKATTVSRDGSTAGCTTIADCFIIWKERLLIYGEFCSNLPRAQELIDKLCEAKPVINEQVTVSEQMCRWIAVHCHSQASSSCNVCLLETQGSVDIAMGCGCSFDLRKCH